MSDTKDLHPESTGNQISNPATKTITCNATPRNGIIQDKSLRSKDLCESLSTMGISHDGPNIASASSVNNSNHESDSSNKSKTKTKNGIICDKSLRCKETCNSKSTSGMSHDGPNTTSAPSVNKSNTPNKSLNKSKVSVQCTKHTNNPESATGGKDDGKSNSATCKSKVSESKVITNESSDTVDNGPNEDTPKKGTPKSTGSKEPSLPDRLEISSSEDVQELSRPFLGTDSLQQESERILTYIKWPHEFVKPKDLAAAGLYYLHTKDLVACAFCRGILGEWQKDDIPYKEHKKHFPHCTFMTQIDHLSDGNKQPMNAALNVQLDHIGSVSGQNQGTLRTASSNIINNMISRPNNLETDVCGRRASDMRYSSSCSPIPDVVPNLADLGLAHHTGPLFQNFVTVNCRITSFEKWPENISQTPKALAEAGFYYINLSDHVMCFHCGGGLRNWRASADPWTEHIKHYPQCIFVLYCNKVEPIPDKNDSGVSETQISEIESPKPPGDVPNDERSTNSNAHLCKICLNVPLEVLFLPCRHLATCPSCASTQSQCPVCKTNIQHVVKVKIP